MEEKKLPIAEIFTSVQGEGLYAGVVMTFIRTAGCSVGKPIRKEDSMFDPLLPVYTEKCTTYDNRSFYCDTDFRTRNVMTINEIMLAVPPKVRHVCITGGEPFIHNLTPLIMAIRSKGKKVHIETSGTIPIEKSHARDEVEKQSPNKWNHVWITVSPKHKVLPDMLRRADEIKILVDEDFSVDKLPLQVREHSLVYVQPINKEHEIDYSNVDRCFKLVKEHPEWRFSIQLHKVIHVR